MAWPCAGSEETVNESWPHSEGPGGPGAQVRRPQRPASPRRPQDKERVSSPGQQPVTPVLWSPAAGVTDYPTSAQRGPASPAVWESTVATHAQTRRHLRGDEARSSDGESGTSGAPARRTSVRTRGHVARPAGRPLANLGCVGRGAAAAHRVSVRAGPRGLGSVGPAGGTRAPGRQKQGVGRGEDRVLRGFSQGCCRLPLP